MALELRIAGPGLDVVRTLEEGAPELVLGRDAECGVCLPDPQRNVSRRHLALWLKDGQLHFRVLSVVNGVEMPFGEAPPGAQGVLPAGQTLKLADYSLNARAAHAGEAGADPWAVFDRDSSGVSSASPAVHQAPVAGAAASFPSGTPSEDDPFGDWGFETTFGPGAPGASPMDAATLGAGDVASLYRGLGLDMAVLGSLSQGELETVGRLMRVLLRGILDLHAAAAGVKESLHAEDRTMVAAKGQNPLKTDWPEETKLRYLFGGRASGIGFINPERALRELLTELVAHQLATGNAVRAAVGSTLKEFEPAALKARLLGEGTRFLAGNKAWHAYAKYFEEQGADMDAWTQRLLDRYFTEAYVREAQRIKRETGPHQP